MTELVTASFHLLGSRADALEPEASKVVSYARTEPERADEPRTRPCLVCKTPFKSQWSGERVCRRCKTAKIWRTSSLATQKGR